MQFLKNLFQSIVTSKTKSMIALIFLLASFAYNCTELYKLWRPIIKNIDAKKYWKEGVSKEHMDEVWSSTGVFIFWTIILLIGLSLLLDAAMAH